MGRREPGATRSSGNCYDSTSCWGGKSDFSFFTILTCTHFTAYWTLYNQNEKERNRTNKIVLLRRSLLFPLKHTMLFVLLVYWMPSPKVQGPFQKPPPHSSPWHFPVPWLPSLLQPSHGVGSVHVNPTKEKQDLIFSIYETPITTSCTLNIYSMQFRIMYLSNLWANIG